MLRHGHGAARRWSSVVGVDWPARVRQSAPSICLARQTPNSTITSAARADLTSSSWRQVLVRNRLLGHTSSRRFFEKMRQFECVVFVVLLALAAAEVYLDEKFSDGKLKSGDSSSSSSVRSRGKPAPGPIPQRLFLPLSLPRKPSRTRNPALGLFLAEKTTPLLAHLACVFRCSFLCSDEDRHEWEENENEYVDDDVSQRECGYFSLVTARAPSRAVLKSAAGRRLTPLAVSVICQKRETIFTSLC